MRILFAASESFPLVKTGGLGDVIYSLAHALKQQGADVYLVLPGYRELLMQIEALRVLGQLCLPGADRQHDVRIFEARHKNFAVNLLVIDCQALYDRAGSPYLHPDGHDWPDNAERYTVFARAVAALSMSFPGSDWRADVVHSHDWQTGLVPAFLSQESVRPATVFTVHSLAYGGHFSQAEFVQLDLPGAWWSDEGAEFYGDFSMLKAGLVYADAITTVSPTYAKEIRTPPLGCRMEGVLQQNRHKLSGILNGIDTGIWNPATDAYLPTHYTAESPMPGKRDNKRVLLNHFGADSSERELEMPLLGMVSRLVEQKGIDLIVTAIPALIEKTGAYFILLGAGDQLLEQDLLELGKQYPKRVFVHIGYSEELAHFVEAGSDLFLMPSRFEPCGLNQMYSLHYGTPPIVYHTGGLVDTVVDTTSQTLANRTANGFVMQQPTVVALIDAVERALDLFRQKKLWLQLLQTGMRQDFGWDKSASAYCILYRNLRAAHAAAATTTDPLDKHTGTA